MCFCSSFACGRTLESVASWQTYREFVFTTAFISCDGQQYTVPAQMLFYTSSIKSFTWYWRGNWGGLEVEGVCGWVLDKHKGSTLVDRKRLNNCTNAAFLSACFPSNHFQYLLLPELRVIGFAGACLGFRVVNQAGQVPVLRRATERHTTKLSQTQLRIISSFQIMCHARFWTVGGGWTTYAGTLRTSLGIEPTIFFYSVTPLVTMMTWKMQ